MSKRGRSILSRLDDAVRWTGMPARVADQLSGSPSSDSRHRPLRWIPIWPIALSCVLFVLSFKWPSVMLTSLGAMVAGFVPFIHMHGPLGKSSLEDDERETALRKDAYLVCFGWLTFLNCVGQLLLMCLSHLQNWGTADSIFVASSALLLNVTLFGCLPTLYASWRWPRLQSEERDT